jgi:S-DNA-T family DNA segregation ATPase FtsK/SpoIIIE
MLIDRIIGRVGADILAKRISNPGQSGDSAALFRLDKLSSSQIAAVARAILANPDLIARVDLMIPEALVGGQGLPVEILISHNAGYVRNNATTAKPAILTANGNEHNLADTLGHVMAIGAKEMRAEPEPWVEATLHAGGLSPVPDDHAVFMAAMSGLLASSELSLVQLGEFCSEIIVAMSTRGLAIRDAVGFALPAAGLPRDSTFFSNAKSFSTLRKPWQNAFAKLFAQRAPLLKKLRQNGQPLDPDELIERIDVNAAEITEAARLALDAFVAAPVGDPDAAATLAQFEWEADGVYLAFDKPKEKQLGLADATVRFFDHDCEPENSLDADGRKQLDDLKSRERRADFIEEDEEFFVKHRRLLEQDAKLCARWEKALYGKPIECNDFFEGFARVVNSLHAGLRDIQGDRILRFTVTKGRKEWRERFNYDAGSYFSAMYRGLKELMGSKAEWKVERLGNASLPRSAFRVRGLLRQGEGTSEAIKRNKVRAELVAVACSPADQVRRGLDPGVTRVRRRCWRRPSSSGVTGPPPSACRWSRTCVASWREGAVGCTEVPRRLVSKKGGVQNVSLLDTGTLEATYSTDAGSLVPAVQQAAEPPPRDQERGSRRSRTKGA